MQFKKAAMNEVDELEAVGIAIAFLAF